MDKGNAWSSYECMFCTCLARSVDFIPLQSNPMVGGLKDPFGVTWRRCMDGPFFPYLREASKKKGFTWLALCLHCNGSNDTVICVVLLK